MKLAIAGTAGALVLLGSGCVTQVKMATLPQADSEHTIIMYQSVRDDTRRFPDYSAIDAGILSTAEPSEGSE